MGGCIDICTRDNKCVPYHPDNYSDDSDKGGRVYLIRYYDGDEYVVFIDVFGHSNIDFIRGYKIALQKSVCPDLEGDRFAILETSWSSACVMSLN